MKYLWLLTKKNLRLLIRAKGSALIVVFAPLLIILILGLSFNNASKYGLNIGVYSATFGDDVNSLITMLQEEEFKIVKYEASVESCIEDLKLGYVHTCVSLPESFAIEGNAQKEITFYVDPSKINLVWMVQRTLQEKLNLKAQEISEGLAGDILTRMVDAKTKIGTENEKLGGVSEKNTQAVSGVAASKDSLSGLDFTSPSTAYDLGIVTGIQENLSSSITASKSKITDAKIAVSGANMSESLKLTLTSLLDQAEKSLNATDLLVNTSTEKGFGAITSLVNGLNDDLTNTKNKLSAASTEVSSATASLESTRQTLQEAVTTLGGIQTALGEVKANLEAQKVTEAGVISSPLITHIETVIPRSTHLNYLFSGLIVLVIMFSSLLLGTTLVLMEKNSPAFIRNFFVPVKKMTFVFSIYVTNLILSFIQVIIILGIALLFLPSFYSSLPVMALILFLAASVFIFLGMIIGYAFSSEDTAVLASISLGSLLLFFSGLILPLESVSPTVRSITHYNPFVIGEKLVREVFFFNTPFSAMAVDLVLLAAYALVLFLAIMILESVLHQHLINKYLGHHHRAHREKDKQKR